jgi:cytochrome c556
MTRITAAIAEASALEEKLAKGGATKEALEANYKAIQASCKSCHAVYRDETR